MKQDALIALSVQNVHCWKNRIGYKYSILPIMSLA